MVARFVDGSGIYFIVSATVNHMSYGSYVKTTYFAHTRFYVLVRSVVV